MGARLLSPLVPQHLHPFLSRYGREDLIVLRDMAAAGDLAPAVGRTHPLADTAEAIKHVGQGHVRGKVVVTV